jgi:hypothetical protein
MAELVLGPLLRYVGETEATVWVETDGPAEVEVMGATAPTFEVEGHHYALVCIGGLEPGETYEYEVKLDGERRWPEEGSEFPPSLIRTIDPDAVLRISFGSCRTCLPLEPPYTLTKDEDERGREFDALAVLATEMARGTREDWPQVLFLLGDQVYVDEGAPQTREFIRQRRSVDEPPGEEVLDFEEYTHLYRESWSEERIRWLFSTVSTSMAWDDHDMSDDWNISRSWHDEMCERDWWHVRVCAGFMAYWLYQHLGNLSPRDLEVNPLWQEVKDGGDASRAVRDFASEAGKTGHGIRWSCCRDLGRTRVIQMDSRAGRVLERGRRSMFDDQVWEWITDHANGDYDHVMLATTVPWLLGGGMHYLEAWDERVADGAWGEAAERFAEWARRTVDFDHWGGFEDSFAKLRDLIAEIGSGERAGDGGSPPATVTVLSGDVHHAYLAEVAYPRSRGIRSAVHQAVCSPFRNPLDSHERFAIRLFLSRATARATRLLARAAGAPDPGIRWRFCEGPFFDNQVASLRIDGRRMNLRLDKTVGGSRHEDRRLERVFDRAIS